VTSAAIIGAGELGGVVAHALAAREAVDRIVLIDPRASAAAGKALDIQQMGAVIGFATQLRGSGDITDAIGASVCIVADWFGSPSPEWADQEGFALIAGTARAIRDVPIVFASTHSGWLSRTVREAPYRRQQVMGSCAEAFVSSIRAIVALEAQCAPAEVLLSLLGAPPDGFVVAWSEATVGGYLLERVLTPVQLTRIQQRVANLWPPRPYALGLAAAIVAESVVHSGRRSVHVLSLLDGEFGVRDRIAAIPAFVASTGIVGTRVPSLSTRERVLLETALGS
jgi:malate dehydrogenase